MDTSRSAATRQRGNEATRQRGNEATRQRGNEATRPRWRCSDNRCAHPPTGAETQDCRYNANARSNVRAGACKIKGAATAARCRSEPSPSGTAPMQGSVQRRRDILGRAGRGGLLDPRSASSLWSSVPETGPPTHRFPASRPHRGLASQPVVVTPGFVVPAPQAAVTAHPARSLWSSHTISWCQNHRLTSTAQPDDTDPGVEAPTPPLRLAAPLPLAEAPACPVS